MSTSNKRFFDDIDLFQQYFISSPSSVKKRLCIPLVPSVPRGGTNYIDKYILNHSTSSDNNLSTNNLLFYSEEMINETNESSNTKNHMIKIESSSIYMLYPQLFDIKYLPSVPVCYKQETLNKNLDRKIETTFE
ncbi:unnamed protein product [Rotaria sp. Silwood1]|nr:unnamed protein product [Rotaria sp. Silwood1]CAF4964495.1 unnamed protein product [Rotaria sp. Silwood1]